MASQRDIGGPIATALFGCISGFLVVAASVRYGHLGRRPAPRPPGPSVVAVGPFAVASSDGGADVSQGAALHGAVAERASPSAPAGAHAYNVLLLTVDTLRFDLGFAGYPKAITPNIDALARRGVVFEREYATASFTPKSLGPMHIGRYASETARDFAHYTTFYPSNVFLAERAHDAGVRTFAGMCHRYFTWKTGFQQGFDVWDTTATPPHMTDSDPRPTGEGLSDVALALLSKRENTGTGHPFFAWFHYFDPHAPYVTHEGSPDFGRDEPLGRAAHARAIYDEEVWYTDREIGRVLAYVAAQPWGRETAIVLTADHGEAFGEHKHWMHGRELWEPLVRVPLVILVPGAAPRHVDVKRSHIDLAPTILELLGVPMESRRDLRGTSLVRDVRAAAGDVLEERDVYIDMPEGPYNEMRRALILGPSPGTKLIDVGGRHYELYDLAQDPDEMRNLASDRARLNTSVEALQKFRSTLHVPSEEPARTR